MNGFAYVKNANEPNRLIVEFPEITRFFTIKGNYDVWSTDYATYSLVYACKDVAGLFRIESAWILARNKQLDTDTITKLKQLLKSKGIDANKFIKVAQTCNN